MRGSGLRGQILTSILFLGICGFMISNLDSITLPNPPAFAQTSDNSEQGPISEDNTTDTNPDDTGNGPISEDNSTESEQSSSTSDENLTGNNQETIPILPEENNTVSEENYGTVQSGTENETVGTLVQENQTSQEIENEMNNEKATHHQTEQEATDIEDAKTNQTIAAEVDIGQGNVSQKSIDNSVTVKTENSTSDTVNLTVSATNQTGPKVILINLNSTTIDVANVKFLHVMYDGNPIDPAANIDEILHTTSSDQPHYAILITQSGAQILISIPHFSTHTITLSSISKVISPVPEFPLSVIAVFASIIAITVAITRKRTALRY